MNANAGSSSMPFDGDSGRRLVWIVPLAIALWIALLTAFSTILERTAPPPPELSPLRAELVVVPPTPAPPAPAAPIVKPAPAIVPPQAVKPRPARRIAHPHFVTPRPNLNGIAKAKKAEPAPTAAATPDAAPPEAASTESGDTSALSGANSDSGGARALFAPKPVIPDDLRDEAIDTVAIAHFTIDDQGKAEVALTQPTTNPRLNAILLETLSQWRFAPATRNGIAIASQFDVRIPITIE